MFAVCSHLELENGAAPDSILEDSLTNLGWLMNMNGIHESGQAGLPPVCVPGASSVQWRSIHTLPHLQQQQHYQQPQNPCWLATPDVFHRQHSSLSSTCSSRTTLHSPDNNSSVSPSASPSINAPNSQLSASNFCASTQQQPPASLSSHLEHTSTLRALNEFALVPTAYPTHHDHHPIHHNHHHTPYLNHNQHHHSPAASLSSPTPLPTAHLPYHYQHVLHATKSVVKPPYSYATLIAWAMKELNKPKITLSDIYGWIMNKFEYYRYSDSSWQNSIRHNLSLNKCFEKVARGKDEPGKGGYWRVNPAHLDLFEMNLMKNKQPQPQQMWGAGGESVVPTNLSGNTLSLVMNVNTAAMSDAAPLLELNSHVSTNTTHSLPPNSSHQQNIPHQQRQNQRFDAESISIFQNSASRSLENNEPDVTTLQEKPRVLQISNFSVGNDGDDDDDNEQTGKHLRLTKFALKHNEQRDNNIFLDSELISLNEMTDQQRQREEDHLTFFDCGLDAMHTDAKLSSTESLSTNEFLGHKLATGSVTGCTNQTMLHEMHEMHEMHANDCDWSMSNMEQEDEEADFLRRHVYNVQHYQHRDQQRDQAHQYDLDFNRHHHHHDSFRADDDVFPEISSNGKMEAEVLRVVSPSSISLCGSLNDLSNILGISELSWPNLANATASFQFGCVDAIEPESEDLEKDENGDYVSSFLPSNELDGVAIVP